MGEERPLWEGVGKVECRIIADRVNSVEISLWTGYILDESRRAKTFGISIFLMGIYRLGIVDSALRTVSSLASNTITDNTPCF